MYSLIYLAGGSGSRIKSDIPKQFIIMGGKPVFMHVLERIRDINEIKEVIIVCNDNYINYLEELLSNYRIGVKYSIVPGGKTRQASVYNGLKVAAFDNVIIHESARPFVKTSEIKKLIDEPECNATFASSIPFTVVKGNNYLEESLNREEILNIQLPQKFNKQDLLDAHESAILDNYIFTDDSTLFMNYKKAKIKVLKGTEYNIKITNYIDLLIGEVIYKEYILGGE